jgi:AraC-like DNA-binding protein
MILHVSSQKIGSNTFSPPSDTARINQIYAYILSHFSENITVEKLAEVANLSTTSFCRYFKKCSNKTFIDFLIEIRMGYACKQLIETDKTVGQICIESGYNSISNFNSYFKKTTKLTPLAYQKLYKK